MKEFSKYFFSLFVAGLVLYFGLRGVFHHRSARDLVQGDTQASMLPVEDSVKESSENNPRALAEAPIASPSSVPANTALAQYQKSFQTMGQCFDTPIGGSVDAVPSDMSTSALEQLITATQGEIVTQNEEWASSDIKTSSGELRRILVQSYSDDPESEVGKKLSYSVVNPDGVLQELPLSDEQKRDPSESLLASLESDGQVTSRSLAKRVFFQNGGDLFVTEKDGALVSYEYTVEGRTFRCSSVDGAGGANINCKCF